jgi:PelA/Pel-15E family pectate lyase
VDRGIPTWKLGRSIALLLLLTTSNGVLAADGLRRYLDHPSDWFAGDEASRIAANILSHQTNLGGWPKNRDTTARMQDEAVPVQATFDNGATTNELRFLARMYQATHDERYRTAFEKGMDYILQAQYANGGWPQFSPPGRGYARYITFNDDAMVRLMEFLRETFTETTYGFLSAARRAFDRGIQCFLKCQIKVDGKLTAWCAQHDEIDFAPRPARTFELASLSGSESVGIVQLLMSLDTPSPEIVDAIDAAAAWFEAAQLRGIRQIIERDEKSPKGTNKVVVKDPSAPPLWARFYEIGTNRPIFTDRDGVPKYDLADIGHERRNGYGWLGNRPQKLLDQDYPTWKKKWRGPVSEDLNHPR